MFDHQKISRRAFLKASGVAAGALMAPGLVSDIFAQGAFPSKQIEALVGFAP